LRDLKTRSEIADRYVKLTPTQQRDILKLLVKRVIVNERGIVTRLELQPPFQYLVSLGNGGNKQQNPAKKIKTSVTNTGSVQKPLGTPIGKLSVS